MWVAVDIQMKDRQFGLVKAITLTSACALMLRLVAQLSERVFVCARAAVSARDENDYPCV